MFDFIVPDNLIAQYPAEPRDSCRLMVLNKNKKEIEHNFFYDLKTLINKGDLLVFNNTRVIKARILANKETGSKIEILLLKDLGNGDWEALISGKKIKEGLEIVLPQKNKVKIIKHISRATFVIRFNDIEEVLKYTEEYGNIPLPPYIKRQATTKDEEMYQTVFSKKLGSVAAPTASLHFTDDLLNQLKNKGVNFGYLTLDVGYGTFAPLKDIENHIMHTETYRVNKDLENLIKQTKANKKRVIAVGTTVVRTLESAFNENLDLIKPSGETDLFIHHTYKFKVPDAIITNFHHHSTTLIHLVGAFAGYDFIEKAYNEAINEKYRMLSYGDGMFIY